MMPRAVEKFYKMALNWPDDPKVADLGRFGAVEGVLARDLFNQMIRYSRANLTDGIGPGLIIGALMSPLPEDQALQLARYLADPGTFGPLVELRATASFSAAAAKRGRPRASIAPSAATATTLPNRTRLDIGPPAFRPEYKKRPRQ